MWVIFFVFTEFVGGLATRKIDGGSCLCVCFFFLQHERFCCRHCSHLTVTPLVPDNLPRSPPINRLAPPRLTLPLTSPPPTHCCPSLSLSSTLSSLEHISIFFFSCPLFCPLHTPSSFACLLSPAPSHLLCGSSLSFITLPSPTVHCLCLYGNPAWTGVAKRSARH